MPALTRFAAAALVALSFSAGPVLAQDVTDYLGVPGPLTFDGTDYLLSWSSQPNAQYIKQEYVPAGQTVENFDSMIMVEFLASEMTPLQMASAQVNMLNERKASDPLVNMDLMQNEQTGEVLLDFIVSAKDEKGEYIVEWNGYRYASAQNAEGEVGGMLFAISHRAYGNEASQAFMSTLRDFKGTQIEELSKVALPAL
ncbi:hypothetical protein [Devosia ginsengisoli]|uniref:DUF1795 domain-containing protein n=1 Tax=Devosia ginsengisoli TaxID=400770 RepID=A0A5B8LUB9_9HYPH|nr:hypothetical protein [Devosia ginsengisoli]QDZ11907.1 hypothetical protein FPZ08_14815 [Devosia ginsengisoli]